MALTEIPIELSSTPSIVDGGNATAITIDSSENVLVNTANAGASGLSLDNGSNLSFAEGANSSIANLFRQTSSAATFLGSGYRFSDAANKAESSYAGEWARTAVGVGYGTIKFYADAAATVAVGTDITPTERMRIDSAGAINIGVTSTIASANNTANGFSFTSAGGSNGYAWFSVSNAGGIYVQRQDNAAAFTFYRGSSAVGSITVTASATAYNTSSDYRLKENVVAMSGATERLKQLNPSRFNFIADADTTVDGFLAHEVQDVVPEAIAGTKDAMKDEEYEVTPAVLDDDGNVTTEAVMGTRSVPDYQGIDQSKLVPLLVATIQELEARLTALENN